MQSITLDLPAILKYGIIGLGALLAVLTYFLIAKEQGSKKERPRFISTIYIFMGFSIVLIIVGAVAESRKLYFNPESIRKDTDFFINTLSHGTARDNFFLGTWKGKGRDIVNNGYEDANRDGYTYDFNFTFSIDSIGRIKLDGTYYGTPKSEKTPPLKPRFISGICIKDGEYLRLIYDSRPQENDRSRGFGVMIFQFLPSNEDASGFYCSRSAKTGALVNGSFTLFKPELSLEEE